MTPRMGIQARLWLAAALPAFVAIAALLWGFSRTHEQEMRASWDERGRALAQQIAGAAAFPLFAGDTAALQRLVDATQAGDAHLQRVQIFSDNGQLLAQATGPASESKGAAPTQDSVRPTALTVQARGRLLEVQAPVVGEDLPLVDLFSQGDTKPPTAPPRPLGHVTIAFDLQPVEDSRQALLWSAAALTLLSFALAAVLSSWIAMGVIRPIRTIADTVRRIGDGQAQARVDGATSGPLRALAEGLNEMGERIDQAQTELRHKLEEREAELHRAFDRLRAAERQNAIEHERKRLIRDMHDGLGSQLVQTLNLVRSSGQQVDSQDVATMLQHALEELRITLDSLEPISGDIATVLGTLRHRISPALNARGIRLLWEVEEVPPVAGLDNQGVLHLFRCLQEVFSNVVQHSGASQVRVQIRMEGPAVVLRVADDGRGLDPMALEEGRPGGRGLAHIRSRAQWMGVPVRFDTHGPGLAVVFEFQPLAGDHLERADSVPTTAPTTATAT